MVLLSDEQAAVIAAALALRFDSAATSAEGCEHLFKVRRSEGESVCVLCRAVVTGPNDFCLSISGPSLFE